VVEHVSKSIDRLFSTEGMPKRIRSTKPLQSIRAGAILSRINGGYQSPGGRVFLPAFIRLHLASKFEEIPDVVEQAEFAL